MVGGNETEDVTERSRGLIWDILWTSTCVDRAKLVHLASLAAGRINNRSKKKNLFRFQKRPDRIRDPPILLLNG